MDGKIARAQGLVTNFGKFGPISGQNASDDRLYRLSWSRQSTRLIVAIIVCRELAVTGLRLLLVEHGEVMAAAWPGKVKQLPKWLQLFYYSLTTFHFQHFIYH